MRLRAIETTLRSQRRLAALSQDKKNEARPDISHSSCPAWLSNWSYAASTCFSFLECGKIYFCVNATAAILLAMYVTVARRNPPLFPYRHL